MSGQFKIEYLTKSGTLTETNIQSDSAFSAKKTIAQKKDFDMHITCEQISEDADEFD